MIVICYSDRELDCDLNGLSNGVVGMLGDTTFAILEDCIREVLVITHYFGDYCEWK